MNGPSMDRLVARIAVGLALMAYSALAGAQSAAGDSLLDRAARGVATARPIRANFEQTLTNPDVKQVRTARGEFAQQGPSKFAFRFTDPAGDAIIADGAAIWVYLPSSARGQALKLPIAQGAQLDLITQLLTLPRASYAITERPADDISGHAVSVFVLHGREGEEFQATVLQIERERDRAIVILHEPPVRAHCDPNIFTEQLLWRVEVS